MRQSGQKIAEPSVYDDRLDRLTGLVDRVADSVCELNDRLDSFTVGSAQALATLAASVQSAGDAFSAIAQGVITGRLRIVDRAGRVLATLGPDADGRGGELRIFDPATGSSVALRA